MASDLVIELPNINGHYEAGIAASSEASLAPELSLPILIQSNTSAAASATNAAIWAQASAANSLKIKNKDITSLLGAGAYACIIFGLCRKRASTENMDCDAHITTEPATSKPGVDYGSAITADNLRRALTVIIATKANYWCMNHHTGQGGVQGYVAKVMRSFGYPRCGETVMRSGRPSVAWT